MIEQLNRLIQRQIRSSQKKAAYKKIIKRKQTLKTTKKLSDLSF